MIKRTPTHRTTFEQFVPRELKYSTVGEKLEQIILSDTPLLEKVVALKKITPKELRALSYEEIQRFIKAIDEAIGKQESLTNMYEEHTSNIKDAENLIYMCDEYIRKFEVLKAYLAEVGKARIFTKVVEWKDSIANNLEGTLERLSVYSNKDPLYDNDFLQENIDQYFKDVTTIRNTELHKSITEKAIIRALKLISKGEETSLQSEKKIIQEEVQSPQEKEKTLIRIIPKNIHASLQDLPVDIQKIEKHEFFKHTPVGGKQATFRPYHVIKDILTICKELGYACSEDTIYLDTHSDTFLVSIPQIDTSILVSNNYAMGTVIFPTGSILTEDICNLTREEFRRKYNGKLRLMADENNPQEYPTFLNRIEKDLGVKNTVKKTVGETNLGINTIYEKIQTVGGNTEGKKTIVEQELTQSTIQDITSTSLEQIPQLGGEYKGKITKIDLQKGKVFVNIFGQNSDHQIGWGFIPMITHPNIYNLQKGDECKVRLTKIYPANKHLRFEVVE